MSRRRLAARLDRWLRRAALSPVDLLSDHLRRDIGLGPRAAMSRQLDRARFGLPL